MAIPSGRSPRTWLLFGLFTLAGACSGDSVDGVSPVGGDKPQSVELERFVRRLHLDLTASPASDEYLADAVAELEADTRASGGSAAARASIADRLIESPEFARAAIDELANRVFGGEDPDDRYDLVCGVTRDDDPACADCPPGGADPCAGCDCEPLTRILEDRQAVRAASDDLAAGTASTSAVDRRFAESTALAGFAAPESLADQVFQLFLGRPAEADEVANARAMIVGALLPDSPAGLLFHRHGATYQDLLDIVFESEVYREAATSAVFERYLGRPASQAEMAHFSAELDPEDPDVRPVIRAVVSSQEYFEQ
jgi:hypothetical protein